MQAKTIKRIIATKIEEWLATITDERLRLDVKKNLILSGGSITNMYLNETVNDYDIYIQDISVLKRLVTYYIQTIYKHTKDGILYTNDNSNDICYILDGRLSKDELINKFGLADYIDKNNLDEKIGSMYSAIRTIKPNQIKMYFGGILGYKSEKKKEDIGKYEVMYISSNSISLSDDIQIVTRFSGTIEEIHKTFDYIHATNYYTTKDGVVTNKEALESILTKQLKYQGSQYPLTSIIRMKKFIKRGWSISAGEILKMIWNCSEYNLKDFDVLEDQLTGVDVAYFQQLLNILKDVSVDKLTTEYISTIIDRVFQEDFDTVEN